MKIQAFWRPGRISSDSTPLWQPEISHCYHLLLMQFSIRLNTFCRQSTAGLRQCAGHICGTSSVPSTPQEGQKHLFLSNWSTFPASHPCRLGKEHQIEGYFFFFPAFSSVRIARSILLQSPGAMLFSALLNLLLLIVELPRLTKTLKSHEIRVHCLAQSYLTNKHGSEHR